MTKKYQITRAAENESLGILRDFIAEGCRESGIPDQTSFELQLCADEACTNIIEHGYAGMNPGSIIFEMEIAEDAVTLFITDFGYAFEPRPAQRPDLSGALEGEPVRGFGLFFIYSIMDSVDYRTGELGNTLIMKKNLR
ncbi:MAG: ATP-binding protein [Bacteroidota bacterium]